MKERLPQSSKEKAESLYAKIERKIGLVNDLWEMAETLPVPKAGDSEEVAETEKNQFRVFLRAVNRSLPETRPKLKKYAEIQKQIRNLKKGLPPQPSNSEKTEEQSDQDDNVFELIEQLRQNAETILDDDDVAFVFKLRKGIENALLVRRKIRNILKELEGATASPSAYDKLLTGEYKKLQGAVMEIIPRNFSLNLITEKTAFEKVFKPTTKGFHPSHQVWNLIKDYEPKTPEEKLVVAFTGAAAALKETIEHENFHVFIEGFLSGEISEFRCHKMFDKIKTSAERLSRLKRIKTPADITLHEKRLLRKKLKTLVDQGQEELMAEIISIPHSRRGQRFPRHTFSNRLRKFLIELKTLRGQDEDVDKIIDETAPYVDIEKIREKIGALYDKVKTDIPEKLKDLDVAFILLPLSKIHHIEHLVERWITTKEKG